MKNKIVLFMIIVFALLMNALCVFGETVQPVEDPFAALTNIFASLASLALAVPVLVQFIKKFIKLEKDFAKQITAWIVSFILTIIGKLLSLGFLESVDWIDTLLYGLAVGLIANGVFDVTIIKSFLQTIFGLRKRS